jgi:hypothetical protein
MPPTAYTLIDVYARLSAADRDRPAKGLANTMGVGLEKEARQRDR